MRIHHCAKAQRSPCKYGQSARVVNGLMSARLRKNADGKRLLESCAYVWKYSQQHAHDCSGMRKEECYMVSTTLF